MELATTVTQTRRLMRSVTVNRPAVRMYQEWRDLARRHTSIAANSRSSTTSTSASTIKVPSICEAGSATTAMAELSLEIPGMLISWKSLPFDSVVQAGEVWFSPLPEEQSEVRLILTWQSTGGDMQHSVSSVEGSVEAQVEMDLLRFKQLMEG